MNHVLWWVLLVLCSFSAGFGAAVSLLPDAPGDPRYLAFGALANAAVVGILITRKPDLEAESNG